MAGAVLNFCFEVAMYVFLTYVFLSILLGRQVGKETRRDFEKDMGKADTGLFYYVLIPGLNESLVIENTLKNMIRHQFHGRIIMIDDFSDDGTADIAERTARLDDRILVLRRHPPRSHIGKGDSLDQAMDFVRSDCQVKHRDMNEVVIGVVDADGGLSETTFEQLNTFFSSPQNVVCQLRVKMDAPFENALQASQDLEFFTVNNMSQNMRMRTHTVGLSGNGQFFRLAPVMQAVGWHPWGDALLDDYELTLKLMLHGIWVKYVDTAFVYQQALSSPYKLMRQRSRWVQGNLDCAKYFKRAIMNTKINGTQKIGILYFLVQPWLNVAADVSVFGLFLISVSKISTLLMDKPSLTGKFLIMLPLLWLFSLFWGVFFEVVYLNDLRKTAETGVSKWQLIALPIIVSYLYLLLFGSLIMAFWRKAIGNNSWVKTARKSA